MLREDRTTAQALAEAIAKLHADVKICGQCYKTFDANHGPRSGELCEFCRNSKRNPRQVLVVEKEVDLENVERTRTFDGLYHVLGGTVSPLDSSAPARLHLREFFERVQGLSRDGDTEVILAMNPTAEGDATALYLERIIAPLKNQYPALKVSRLGRGLSTGSELEYTDEVTIANALWNRR